MFGCVEQSHLALGRSCRRAILPLRHVRRHRQPPVYARRAGRTSGRSESQAVPIRADIFHLDAAIAVLRGGDAPRMLAAPAVMIRQARAAHPRRGQGGAGTHDGAGDRREPGPGIVDASGRDRRACGRGAAQEEWRAAEPARLYDGPVGRLVQAAGITTQVGADCR